MPTPKQKAQHEWAWRKGQIINHVFSMNKLSKELGLFLNFNAIGIEMHKKNDLIFIQKGGKINAKSL